MLEDFFSDARYGLRHFSRNPLVTVVCVVTLALGIGVNAAIFSMAYSVLLRPLPFCNAERLLLVTEY